MKRFWMLLLATLLLLCSCGSGSVSLELSNTHELSRGLTVHAPKEWKSVANESEADLYLEDTTGSLFLMGYVYSIDELVEGMTGADFFSGLNNLTLKNCTDTTVIRAYRRSLEKGVSRYSYVCSAENNGKEYGYYFGAVDFGDTLIWFMSSSSTKAIKKYTATFDAILAAIECA